MMSHVIIQYNLIILRVMKTLGQAGSTILGNHMGKPSSNGQTIDSCRENLLMSSGRNRIYPLKRWSEHFHVGRSRIVGISRT